MGGLRMENEKELKITPTRKKQIESKKKKQTRDGITGGIDYCRTDTEILINARLKSEDCVPT